ncbi:DHH family phosphoesterase [Candidatus Saccharibacteria bacterium]|nr:DHH family phosphoesterase [Candidatus Saccharibacteria bacterium]
MNTIVTTGYKFMDIDSYACMVAYAELLGGLAVSDAPMNLSIVDSEERVVRNYQPNVDDKYIIVDISDPSKFNSIVHEEQIIEVIDHHFGFEGYWKERGVAEQIEKIGAAATIIWERWRDAEKLNEMSEASGRLLMQAILDNTLDFMANVANERDKTAYDDLTERFGDMREEYFAAVEENILRDLAGALRDDMKQAHFKTLGREVDLYQLAVWDANRVLEQEDLVLEIIGDGLLNLISISKSESQIITRSAATKKLIDELMNGQKLFLRKEVMKRDLEA